MCTRGLSGREEGSLMASFIKSQGHPINGQHTHNHPVGCAHGTEINTSSMFFSRFPLHCIIFSPHWCSLTAIFIRAWWPVDYSAHHYCRTELPNVYSGPDGQTKLHFNSQLGTTPESPASTLMVHDLSTVLHDKTLKCAKIISKIQLFTGNSALYGHSMPHFFVELLSKHIFLIELLAVCVSFFVIYQWVCQRSSLCNLRLRAMVVKKEKKNLVSKVTRRRLILHMILAAGMFPLLSFNSAERGVTDYTTAVNWLDCWGPNKTRVTVHACWTVAWLMGCSRKEPRYLRVSRQIRLLPPLSLWCFDATTSYLPLPSFLSLSFLE